MQQSPIFSKTYDFITAPSTWASGATINRALTTQMTETKRQGASPEEIAIVLATNMWYSVVEDL